MKTIALIQARMGSTRLPNKVMKKMCGVPMIELLLTRLSGSEELDQIIVATSRDPRNGELVEHVRALGYYCEQGSENDVLERFFEAAQKHGADSVVRITGDCPLVDPELVDECIRQFYNSDLDYFNNIDPPTYPDGLDIEVFKFSALEKAHSEAVKAYDREHVTPYIRESDQFDKKSMQYRENLSELRWTVDETADFQVIENVFSHFHPRVDFG